MRAVLIILALLAGAVPAAWAQSDVPIPVAAAEVFFDLDPGEGAGTVIDAPADGVFDSPVETLIRGVSLDGLTPGIHTVFVRVREGGGAWSPPLPQSLYLPAAPSELPPSGTDRIAAAEVFFDSDPGQGKALTLTQVGGGDLGARLEEVERAAALAGLAPGIHSVYVRAQNGAGLWSTELVQTLYVPKPVAGGATEAVVVLGAEYAIDGGAFQPAPAEDGAFGGVAESINLEAPVETGVAHAAGIRFVDSLGRWSGTTDGSESDVPYDSDWDGLPDAWELDRFGTLSLGGSADSDGDGLSNADEFLRDSDPLVPDRLGAPPTLSGFVRETQGQGLRGATLCFSLAEGPEDCTAQTDTLGHYILGGASALAAGTYQLRPQSPAGGNAYGFAPTSRQATLGTASIRSLDFVAQPLAVDLTGPVGGGTYRAKDRVTLTWSGNGPADAQVVLAMKRDAVPATRTEPLPDDPDWYRFTLGTANDGVEDVTLPAGLSLGGDWRFTVGYAGTAVQGQSTAPFTYTRSPDLAVTELQVGADRALEFDGLDDQVEVDDADGRYDLDTWTIEARVRPFGGTSGSGRGPGDARVDVPIVWKAAADGAGALNFGLVWRGDCFAALVADGVTGALHEVTTSPLAPDADYRLAASFDGTRLRLFVDGVAEVATEIGGPLVPPKGPAPLRLGGAGPGGAGALHGTLGEVRLWSFAREPAEIARDLKRRLHGTESGLVGDWAFEEAAGDLAVDWVQGGRDGLLGGGEADQMPARVIKPEAEGPTAEPGQAIEVLWTVANGGEAAAVGTLTDRIWLSGDAHLGNDSLLATVPADTEIPLAPGAAYRRSRVVDLPQGLASGTWSILVQTDPTGAQVEADVGNNVQGGTLTIAAQLPVDLAVSAVAAPDAATPGRTIEVRWTEGNLGSGLAVAPWRAQVLLSGAADLRGARVISAVLVTEDLEPGASAERVATVTLPAVLGLAGPVWIGVRADGDGVLSDQDRGNNAALNTASTVVARALGLTLPVNQVAEDAATPIGATLMRSGETDAPLTLSIESSDPGEARVPAEATIPAGQSSVQLPIYGVQDGLVDGNQTATITVAAPGYASATTTVRVLDSGLGDLTGPSVTDLRFDGSPLASGAILTRPGQVSLNATDLSGISRVEFSADGHLIATDSNGSTQYAALWEIAAIPDGPHTLTFDAFDTLGNKATVTLSVTVALAPPAAPSILQPATGLLTNQAQVTVAGQAEKGSQVLLYRNGTAVAGPLALDAANAFSVAITLAEGANDLRAAAQNRGGLGPLSAAVRATLDINIPPTPANLFAQAREAGVVRLTWTAVSDQAVVGYDLYRATAPFTAIANAIKVNATPLPAAMFDDLPGVDGIYYYRVVSRNAADSPSALSNQISIAADATPPGALSIQYAPQGAHDAVSGRMAPGRVDVTLKVNEPLLATPFLTLTPAAGVPITVPLTQVDATDYQGHFEITTSTPSGLAYAVFSARDRVGNRGTDIVAGGSILVDTTGPLVTGLTVTPAEPIRNDPTPATVQVHLELDTVPAGSGMPELSYLLSAAGRQRQAITLTRASERGWSGTFTLPADAGASAPEVLEFGFRAVDDLGNVTDKIQGGNRFQVYQGALPPLDVPAGLLAQALPGGEVRLTWNPVTGAADYQLFRAAAGETELSPYRRTADALELIDSTTADGRYRYAVASVRQANAQEGISAHGPVVEVDADATAPAAPTNLTLELTGAGIHAAWQAPADEPNLTYRLYRDAVQIISLAGLSPVLTDLRVTTVTDGAPSATAHFYAVSAVDAAGNESAPSVSVYLNFGLLPVANLAVSLQDQALPEVTWSAPSTTAAGYNIYLLQGGQTFKLNSALLTEPGFTDAGYTGEQRQYAVAAVDDHAVEGPRRQVLLPRVGAVTASTQLKRGVMNRLDYQVRNDSTQALNEVRLQAQVGAHVQRSLPFSVGAGATQIVTAIVGGFADLPDMGDLVTTLEVTSPTGEQARIVRTAAVTASDDALAVNILTDAFTRGGTGRVRFSLHNTSAVEVEIVTATGAGDASSDQVRFLLQDQDGNVLGTQSLRQALGEGVLTLPNGKTVARIPAGGTFTSAPVDLQVPLSTPEKAVVQLVIDQVHYHLGQDDQVSIPGFDGRRAVSLVDVSYSGEIADITPAASFGDQPIVITGRALAKGSANLMPQVPLKLVLVANGFERGFDVATDADGNFTYSFTPLSGESGIYQVSAVHPDLLERPAQGQFTIGRVIASPAAVALRMAKGQDQDIPVRLTAGAGTAVTNVRLVFEPADQPLGALPDGIALTLPDPVSLGANQSVVLTLGVHADSTAAAAGTFVVTLKTDESGDQTLGTIRVDYSLSEAAPALYFAPSYIETGVALSDSVTEQVTLENRGFATSEGVTLTLLMPDGSPAPAWAFLSSAAAQGNLAVGETRPVSVTIAPSAQVAEGTYAFALRVASANAAATDIPVYASVTRSGVGSALIHLSDIYTATVDNDGNLIQGLAGAEVWLQNEAVLTVEQTLSTDAKGEALFRDLPVGHYKFRARASNHQEVIGRLWIKPGITQSQEVFLDSNLVTVQWSVTEVPLQDRYEITLNPTYETDVPAPVVVIEPGSINLPEMQAGDVYYGEFTLTNYGLIRADDLNFTIPQNDAFKVELLSGLPTSLDAKQRVTIPYRVTALKSLNKETAAAGAGCRAQGVTIQLSYVSRCANGASRTSGLTFTIGYIYGNCNGQDYFRLLVGIGTFVRTTFTGSSGAGSDGPAYQTIAGGAFCELAPQRYEPDSLRSLGDFIAHNVGCSVNTVLREFNDEVLDVTVKVPGGTLDIPRRFYGDAWHWGHERDRLQPFWKTAGGGRVGGRPEALSLAGADAIVRAGVIYNLLPGSQGIWRNESSSILIRGAGYLWEDKYGNWESYDITGRFLAFGPRTGTLANLIYADGAAERPSGITDGPGHQVIWFEYDAQQHLTAIQDILGRRVQYQYSGDLLTGVTDPIGGQTGYEYDGKGRLTRKVDPAGRPTMIGYDRSGNAASVVGEDGTGTFFDYSYDERTKERYAQIKTSAGKVTEVWYDSTDEVKRVDINGRTFRTVEKDGRARITTDEKGNITREERDEWDDPTRILYPDGSQVSFEYVNTSPTEHLVGVLASPVLGLGRHLVERIVDQRGYATRYAYDTRGNLTRKVEALGTADERATRFAFDEANRLTEITLEADEQTAAATTSFTYDAVGNIASTTDAEGNRTEFPDYDVAGNLLRMRDPRGYDWTFQYDRLGRLTGTTDPEGNTTTYEFDGANNPTAVIDAYAKRFGFAYNDRNQVTRTTDAGGNIATIAYNSDGLPVELIDAAGKSVRHEYDNERRLLATLVGSGATGYATRFDYDETMSSHAAASLPVKIRYPTYATRLDYDRLQRPVRATDVLTPSTSQSATTQYDVAGNVIARTDEEGRTTHYAYDALNRLVETRDPAEGVTSYSYDDRGNQVSVTDPNSGTTRFEYDRNGWLTTLTRPLGETTRYEYDAAGNRTAVIDAKGQRVQYQYSPANRLIQESHYATADAQTPVSVIAYSYDKLGRMTGYDDGTTSAAYTYDDLGRKTGASVDYGAFTLDYAYTYYPNGQKETFTGPDGVTYRYLYDGANRLSAIELPDGKRVTYNSYSWTRPTRMTLPGGLTVDYGYDPRQRVSSIDATGSLSGLILTQHYSRTPTGNITAMTTQRGDYTFQYDVLDQLTGVAGPLLAPETYTYDALGNRLTAVGVAGPWNYDGDNRLLGYGNQQFEYDDNGNLTRRLIGATAVRFVYDIMDRLVRVEHDDGSVIAEYSYDPFGRRLWKDVNGTRTYYAYADEGLIGEYDSQGSQARGYGWRPDSQWSSNPLFQQIGDNYYWYQNDQLGTPQRLVDAAGRVVWVAYYSAFGQARISTAEIQNNLRLPGQYYDGETGLHYNWHRYYDPLSGRYLSTDPLIQGLHPYLYALNNPLLLVDPDGTHAVRGIANAFNNAKREAARRSAQAVAGAGTDRNWVAAGLLASGWDIAGGLIPGEAQNEGQAWAGLAGDLALTLVSGGLSAPAMYARYTQTALQILSPIINVGEGDMNGLAWDAVGLGGSKLSNILSQKSARLTDMIASQQLVFMAPEVQRRINLIKRDINAIERFGYFKNLYDGYDIYSRDGKY